MYTLYAQRDGDERFIDTAGSLAQLERTILYMEDEGTWPEGYDAVARCGSDTWVYADEWERM